MEELKILRGNKENLPTELNQNNIYITIPHNIEEYSSMYVNGKEFVSKPNIVEIEGNTITLNPKCNTVYKCGVITSLTISSFENSELETLIYFTSGNSCQVVIPECEIVGDVIIDPNHKYVFSVLNGVLIMGEINDYIN